MKIYLVDEGRIEINKEETETAIEILTQL